MVLPKYIPKDLYVCVLGLCRMELTFDLCDCIPCLEGPLQSTTCLASHASILEKQQRQSFQMNAKGWHAPGPISA